MRKILRGHVINKRFLFTLCLGFAFLFETHAQVSGTFTINSAVATGGTNFQSFSDAAAFLSGGVNGAVVFNVNAASGPYNEQVVLSNIAGTSPTNTITFNCNGVTLTFLSFNTTHRAGIKLNNTDYVTFDNLTVVPQAVNINEFGYGFQLLNDADHNTIKNCHINENPNWDHPESTTGIVINGNDARPTDAGNSNCDDNLITQNVIDGCGVGITFSSRPVGASAAQYMNNNKVLNNTITNFLVTGLELYYNNGTVVDGNQVTGGINTYITTCISLNEFNQSVSVTNNRIHDFWIDPSMSGNELYGIKINSESVAGKECLIANNLIYNWSSSGLMYGICTVSAHASFFNVYNNTISLDDQTQQGDITHGINFDDISDVNFMNNIVTVSRQIFTESYGIYILNVPARFKSDRNVLYVPLISVQSNFGLYNGNPIDILSNWRVFTNLDLFSTEINPGYVDVSTGNLRPTAQAVDNMASYVSLNTDIVNAARNTTTPDPGCFEFTSAACSTPVTGGLPIISPDSVICQGPKVALSLSGNSAGGGQTYTWQTSTTQSGTFTDVSSALGYPYFEVTPSATLYYRVKVTCGATVANSTPIRILVTTSLNGGTYTINKALPTGGINFNSFSDVVRALQCGFNGSLVFNVASGSGPYNEQMIIPAVNTSASKTITFNGNGATITYLPTTNTQSAVVKLDGADYITIDSLNVEVQGAAATGYGFGIQLKNDADNNIIKRCTVSLNKTSTSAFYAGIVMNGLDVDPKNEITASYCDNNLITNNTVIGGYYGITCASASDFGATLQSKGNIIRKNVLLDNCAFGMYIAGAENLLVDSNDISHPTRTVFSTNPFVGIQAIQLNLGMNVTKNRIHDLLQKVKTSKVQLDGIKFDRVNATAAQPNVVSNNVLYYFNGIGIQEGLYTLLSDNLKFYHNTVSLEDTSAAITLTDVATRGFGLFGGTSTGVELKNNSIVIRRGGVSPKYCVFLNIADSGLVANYNNYYMRAAAGTTNLIGFMETINYPTLASWLATRKDSSNINIGPVYNDIANGDLTPTKIPFENRGTNVGVTNDTWNVTRNTTKPDIGAYEFTICKALTNPVLVVEEAGVHTIKFSWLAIPNTTGYRVSRDGINWTIPSSGAMGLSHIVTGLKPTDTIGLMVKALGTRVDCPEYFSNRVVGQALTDGIYVPNTFTPNGNGQNDVFKIYSNTLSSVRWMVFNQWGEKVFESTDKNGVWDGSYKGKPQPIGVYVFVLSGTLTDGTKVTQKGTFNLVR